MAVVVVGGGVMGFTSALRLLQSGVEDVTIVAEKFSPIPSKSSPAVFRPAWLGRTPIERVVKWGKETAQELHRLYREGSEKSGISCVTHCEFFRAEAGLDAANPDPALLQVMPGFRAMTQLELDTHCPEASGGWTYTSFMIEGARYLKYLEEKCLSLGLKLLEAKVEGAAQSEEWCRDACRIAGKDATVVVNAMGLAGGPECYPIRGDLVLVKAPYVRTAVAEYHPADPLRPTYIYPRQNHVVLGSFYLEGDGSREHRPEAAQDVIDRCSQLIPELKHAPVLAVVACIRPGRADGVRLDAIRVGPFTVVNNYGHGGGGMGTCWGCAKEVCDFTLAALGRPGQAFDLPSVALSPRSRQAPLPEPQGFVASAAASARSRL